MTRQRHMVFRRAVLALPALVLLAAGPRREAYGPPAPPPPPSPYDLCEAAIGRAQGGVQARLIPSTLLPAISRVESGRLDPAMGRVRAWPWTINTEGRGSFFDSKAEAIAAVQAIQSRGQRSIDVGCMQVNLMHHPTAFPNLETAFDPDANAAYAGRFLLALYGATRDWNLAAAYYHSQTQERGEDYQRRVFGRVMTPMGPMGSGRAAKPTGPYGAFLPEGAIYGAFPPASSIYGAFAPPVAGVGPGRAARR